MKMISVQIIHSAETRIHKMLGFLIALLQAFVLLPCVLSVPAPRSLQSKASTSHAHTQGPITYQHVFAVWKETNTRRVYKLHAASVLAAICYRRPQYCKAHVLIVIVTDKFHMAHLYLYQGIHCVSPGQCQESELNSTIIPDLHRSWRNVNYVTHFLLGMIYQRQMFIWHGNFPHNLMN